MANQLPAGFRLNRQKFVPQTLPRIVQRTIALLERLPKGDLLTSQQLASALGVGYGHFSQYKTFPALSDFRRRITHDGRRMLAWGSRPTIKQFDKDTQ